ncbi:MAG TPA: GNAT family N-acetyltransferase [Terriglobia bacterium]|nr:GNAT family N-acetyltransferase [Terriglobia bacterium]
MQCELVTDFSRLEELSADWNRWVRNDESATIFQRWEWIKAYWSAYRNAYSLCSVLIREGPRPLGVLPLVRRGRAIELLGAREGDYNDLITDAPEPARLLEAALSFLLAAPVDWNTITFDKIPSRSKIYRSLESLPAAMRRRLHLVFRCDSPTVLVSSDTAAGLDTLIRKKQLERYEKKLQRLGPVVFRHFDTREEARRQLDRFFDQHVTRWAMAQESSQFRDAECRDFYRALVEEFDPREDLRFGALEVNSQPIAYHFGFQSRGTLTWYKPSFDVNYWDYCPGDVLLRGLLQYVRSANLNELDFTLGDEPFKYRFANHTRENYILYMERHPHRVNAYARTLTRYGQHALRKRPQLKSKLKALLRRARAAALPPGAAARAGWRRVSGVTAGLCRRIWSVDHVRFWALKTRPQPEEAKIEIAPASLDDLVRLSVDFGDFLTPEQLHGYRRMVKQGRRVFIARATTGAFVLAASEYDEIRVPSEDSSDALKLPERLWVISESWQAPNPHRTRVNGDIFRALGAHLPGKEIWFYDGGKARISQDVIRSAGLEFRCRWARSSLLRRFGRARLEAPGMANAPVLTSSNPVRVGLGN